MSLENIDRNLLKILQQKASGTVAIFERNDFYRCYEDDAFLVANEIFLSEVGLRRVQLGLAEVTYHNLNSGQYMRVVRDVILMLHYRLEVYEECDGRWQLKAKGSLGCLGDFEDLIGNSVELSELSTVMALKVTDDTSSDEHRVSVACCNAQDLRMTVAEFTDSSRFPSLEKCIVSLVPRECIVLPSSSSVFQWSASSKGKAGLRVNELETALKRANVSQIPFVSTDEKTKTSAIDVMRLVQNKCKDVHISGAQMECLKALVHHLHLENESLYEGRFQLVNYKSAGYMYMDMAAVKALELFAVSFDEDSAAGESGTLFELMNKCRTPQGQRLLRDWLRRPLFDLRRINERLDVVEALSADHECRTVFYDDLLRKVPDVAALSRKLVQKKASLQDCYRLYQLVSLLRRLEDVLKDLHNSCGSFAPSVYDLMLEPVCLSVEQFKDFSSLIEMTVDIEHYEKTGSFRIKPSVDDELQDVADKMDSVREDCEKELAKVSKVLGESVKLDSNAAHGFIFRVTLKAEKALRQTGYKILDVTKGSGVHFTSKALAQLNEGYSELQSRYDDIQAALVGKVVDTSASYLPAVKELSDRLAVVDTLVAFSILSAGGANKYVRPELLEKGTGVLALKGCRHPVMETLQEAPFIPNDVLMGDTPGDETRFLLLTGANMGGKSTYLRACSLTVLMAQMGSFVPCDSAKFSIIDGIHTRIGSCDYQCKGVSTFMAEMIDSASILEAATCYSLVIIDELGRGTSTYDGFGLAWAIADDILSRVRCFCLFATHFHEMTGLHEAHPRALRNVCVSTHVDESDQLTLLYKIVPGTAELSFGINIAKLVGLPSHVVQVADEMLKKLNGSLEENTKESALLAKLKQLKGEQLRDAILRLVPC